MTDVVAPSTKVNLLELDRAGMERFFADIGEQRFRAHQMMKWIYHHRVTDFGKMTDVGKALRAKLAERAEIRVPKILVEQQSTDGTTKWVLGLEGGNAIETVYIPEPTRGTLCVSSQVG
ncbi:MAG TPA: 23S rRNA (adenine(2503)-C(2))-methyltransferase RlmN, partial [Xanthomonadales bacterium]|nr:23S rRNA (adenine(2503)-C(2))-methyltransferase RlmN [Xanthomonadales bacterium]